jgi:hypothetical protein
MSHFFYKVPGFKKYSSLLLIFVFILGITPKKTLHTWFANHTDTTSSTPVKKAQQLSKTGFNCKCDDLVAESHFISPVSLIVINSPIIHSFFSFDIISFVSIPLFHNNLRGPPLKF